jgi:prepilin-type N-terminal cleavage/methylation domain-containing protein
VRLHSGFTLVEIVVALLVLSVGLLSTVSGLVLAGRIISAAGEHTAAAVAAVGQLELWLGTRCGIDAGDPMPGDPDRSWATRALGNSIETTTIVAVTTVGRRVRPDTFTVTGGC